MVGSMGDGRGSSEHQVSSVVRLEAVNRLGEIKSYAPVPAPQIGLKIHFKNLADRNVEKPSSRMSRCARIWIQDDA